MLQTVGWKGKELRIWSLKVQVLVSAYNSVASSLQDSSLLGFRHQTQQQALWAALPLTLFLSYACAHTSASSIPSALCTCFFLKERWRPWSTWPAEPIPIRTLAHNCPLPHRQCSALWMMPKTETTAPVWFWPQSDPEVTAFSANSLPLQNKTKHLAEPPSYSHLSWFSFLFVLFSKLASEKPQQRSSVASTLQPPFYSILASVAA